MIPCLMRLFSAGALFLILLSCEARPPFPPVEYSKLTISLIRSACYGSCPDYQVTISGTGEVVFSTREPAPSPVAEVHREYSESRVVVTGKHRAKINPAKVRTLVAQFRAARFFQLKDAYIADITDSPTYVVRINTGSIKKSVVDYVGREEGMPAAVTQLQDAIDAAAGTKRWIDGTPEVIPLLQGEGADFSGLLGLKLMAAAASRNDVPTMQRLQKLGAPLHLGKRFSPLDAAASEDSAAALSWLLAQGGADAESIEYAFESAVSTNSQRAFDVLQSSIRTQMISKEDARRLLGRAASNGNVAMATYFLKFRPALIGSDTGPMIDSPLAAAASGSCLEEKTNVPCKHRKVVELLLQAGADPKWYSPLYRNSVLFLVSDLEIAKMLLRGGADPNFRDSDGEPIIFSISDEDVALAMFDAGATFDAVRPADGMTLRRWAEYEKWPRVIARLDKAGVK